MFTRNISRLIRSGFICLCLLMLCSVTLAQSSPAPIQIGQNAIAALTADAKTAQYALTAQGGDSITIQVLGLSAGFVPRFRVLNPAGAEVLNVPNPTGLATLSANAVLGDAGVYIIEISGENNSLGQYALSLTPGAPPAPLAVNTLVSDSVGSQTPVRVYEFSTTPANALVLTILSQTPDSGLEISLFNEDTSKTIATNDAGISGIAYRLPPQNGRYHAEVRSNGAAGDQLFSICLGDCGAGLLTGQATTEVQATVAPTVAAAQATCTVAPGVSGSVNVRSGPGTIYAIISILPAGQTAPVLGQLSGESWFEISWNGYSGWVAASVAKLAGDCTALATVAPPANAPLAPTLPPPARSSPHQRALWRRWRAASDGNLDDDCAHSSPDDRAVGQLAARFSRSNHQCRLSVTSGRQCG